MARNIDPELLQKHRDRAYKRTFSTQEGQMVLRDLCRSFHLYDHLVPPLDPYAMAYREGTRAVVIDLIQKINADPDRFMQETITSED